MVNLLEDISEMKMLPVPTFRMPGSAYLQQISEALQEINKKHDLGWMSQIVHDYCFHTSSDMKQLLIEATKRNDICWRSLGGRPDIETYINIIKQIPSILLVAGGMHIYSLEHALYVYTCEHKAYGFTWKYGENVTQLSRKLYYHELVLTDMLMRQIITFPSVRLGDEVNDQGYEHSFSRISGYYIKCWVHSLARP